MTRSQRTQLDGIPAFWGLAFLILVAGPFSPASAQVEYNRDVQPILADKCFACHGRDEKKRAADLRLDSRNGAVGTEDGAGVIVPGKLAESEFWARLISEDPEERMPPAASHKSLDPAELEILKQWILEGASYQNHWSLEPIARVTVPRNEIPVGHNEIDWFVTQRLRSKKWSLMQEASRAVLIRRVAFALTGLPPTLEDQNRFFEDPSPEAYEKMVDRYLASDQYGEEMARHWLDIARYADTHGLHLDNERQMWAYRDWVVNSFNRNQPFNQFTIEQLAGDLLPSPTQDQLVATGFNRCNVTTSEGGAINEEFQFRYAVDRTSTVVQTWLGLTAGCATCHDHKFDPISMKEFYSLYAFFNSAADPAMDGNALLTNPVLRLDTEESRRKLADLNATLETKQKNLDAQIAEYIYRDPAETSPPSVPAPIEQIWLDDDFPSGGRLTFAGHPTQFITATDSATVFSGQKAIRRTDPGLAQDVWENSTVPLRVPAESTFFAAVFLDPTNPPKTLMLQYFKNGWLHRAVWGDYDAIPWGTPNTPEKVHVGALPASGSWVQLEVPTRLLGLNPGDLITGFALTQFGGTVVWDRVGVRGLSDPAQDPSLSFKAWWSAAQGKGVPGLPGDLNEAAKKGPVEGSDPATSQRLLAYYLTQICESSKAHFQTDLQELAALRKERDAFEASIPRTFVFRDLEKRRDSFVMLRGQYDQKGEAVEPNVPAALPALNRRDGSRAADRLDLANWIVSADNPLTARVAVNRFWQQFFGTGLVKTSGDFGTQGELPSHPELLDFLAIRFRESGWNVKELVKLFVMSATFRQDSKTSAEQLETDPENRLLSRGPRLRLDAEQIRDNALQVSGLLDTTKGGKGVKPYQPPNIWEPVGYTDSNTRFYKQDSGTALYRRSLYTFFKRTAPPPFMVNFDAPNREQSCSRRERSNTPLQALQLLNDIQHVEAARLLATRACLEGGNSSSERITYLFRVVLARLPDSEELSILENQLTQHLKRYQADAEGAKKLISVGEMPPHAQLPPEELAAYSLLASTLLNLDETLTRN